MKYNSQVSVEKLYLLVTRLINSKVFRKEFDQCPEQALKKMNINDINVQAIKLPNLHNLERLAEHCQVWLANDGGDIYEETNAIPPFFRFNFRTPAALATANINQ